MAWYVGLKRGVPKLMYTLGGVTRARFPQFDRVVGPFRDKLQAGQFIRSEIVIENPGESWHEDEERHARGMGARSISSDARHYYAGLEEAHRQSRYASRERLMPNPPGDYASKRMSKPVHGTIETEIYGDIETIEAKKGKESLWPKEKFRHKFTKRGSKIYGLRDGSLLIKGKRRLWNWFDY